jgi:ribosome maturation factor RimP
MGASAPIFLERAGPEGTTGVTDTYTKEQTLTREIAPTVEGTLPDVSVLAVELLSPSRFCVYVDRPGGVDLALCERVTRLLDDYRNDYTIDVSSPGPERPLRTAAHFANAVGQRVQIRTRAAGGVKRWNAVVVSAGDRAVVVDAAGDEREIPYEDIVRANLIDEGRKGS